jgi:hypothetical protein
MGYQAFVENANTLLDSAVEDVYSNIEDAQEYDAYGKFTDAIDRAQDALQELLESVARSKEEDVIDAIVDTIKYEGGFSNVEGSYDGLVTGKFNGVSFSFTVDIED